jgi:hypothetical protein
MLMQMIAKACLTGNVTKEGQYCFAPELAKLVEKNNEHD